MRTNNKLNPHLTPSPGLEPRPLWWQASALTTAPSLLPNEHKKQSSAIGKHYSDKYCIVAEDLDKQFFILKKCRNKFDCLGPEMLPIRESLNVHSTQFELNYLHDSALIINANLQLLFLTVYSNHF